MARLRDGYLTLKENRRLDGQWNTTRVRAALQDALSDPGIEIVLAVGSLVTREAAREEIILSKPVVSTFVHRADIYRLPCSGAAHICRDNLSLMASAQRAVHDVEVFRQMVNFDTLHVLVDRVELEVAESLSTQLHEHESTSDIGVRIVTVENDDRAILNHLDARVDAVYLTLLPRLAAWQRLRLFEELKSRRIPTFSLVGQSDVKLGVLASQAPNVEVAKHVARSLYHLTQGGSVRDLPIALPEDGRLLINARTASAIGYAPNVETRAAASFLFEEAMDE